VQTGLTFGIWSRDGYDKWAAVWTDGDPFEQVRRNHFGEDKHFLVVRLRAEKL